MCVYQNLPWVAHAICLCQGICGKSAHAHFYEHFPERGICIETLRSVHWNINYTLSQCEQSTGGVPYIVYPIPISNAYPSNTNKNCTFIAFEAHIQCFYCVRFGAVVQCELLFFSFSTNVLTLPILFRLLMEFFSTDMIICGFVQGISSKRLINPICSSGRKARTRSHAIQSVRKRVGRDSCQSCIWLNVFGSISQLSYSAQRIVYVRRL